ncbi:MAG TPA: hypothetical protein VF600_04545 [Abditibacteriaceae bacterium]
MLWIERGAAQSTRVPWQHGDLLHVTFLIARQNGSLVCGQDKGSRDIIKRPKIKAQTVA